MRIVLPYSDFFYETLRSLLYQRLPFKALRQFDGQLRSTFFLTHFYSAALDATFCCKTLSARTGVATVFLLSHERTSFASKVHGTHALAAQNTSFLRRSNRVLRYDLI